MGKITLGNMRMRRKKQKMFQKFPKRHQRRCQKKMEVQRQKTKLKRFKEDVKESKLQLPNHQEEEKESQLMIQSLPLDLGSLTGIFLIHLVANQFQLYQRKTHQLMDTSMEMGM